ncbi:MAG: putative capsular polysaccharide synthesis family protein [Leptolyngbyaceae cyanobacterium]
MKLKSLAQSLLQQNYEVTHSYHHLRLWLEGTQSSDKIIIYQMGKVGSTTIWDSLEALNLDIPIYHIHTLKPEIIQKAADKGRSDFPKLRFVYPEIVQSEYLRKQLDRNAIKTPWHVITLVRDPIAKTLSLFFQQLEQELLLGTDYRQKIKEEGQEAVLQKMIGRFHQEYIRNPDRKHPFYWINREIKDNLALDIFAEPPLSDAGYRIYKAAAANILLLKLESLSDCHQQAFQEFLGLQNFQLVQSNVGSQKRYGSLYKAFLKQVDLPADYLEEIYGSKLVTHFYSASEIERFYQRWRTA